MQFGVRNVRPTKGAARILGSCSLCFPYKSSVTIHPAGPIWSTRNNDFIPRGSNIYLWWTGRLRVCTADDINRTKTIVKWKSLLQVAVTIIVYYSLYLLHQHKTSCKRIAQLQISLQSRTGRNGLFIGVDVGASGLEHPWRKICGCSPPIEICLRVAIFSINAWVLFADAIISQTALKLLLPEALFSPNIPIC